jgi:flagellar basal body-associated protein FliL
MGESSQDLTHIYLEQIINYTVFGLETIIIIIIIVIAVITLAGVFRISLLSLKKKGEEEEGQQRPKQIVYSFNVAMRIITER